MDASGLASLDAVDRERLYLGAQIPLMSFAVLFLHDVHGLSPARAGVVLAIFQAGAVLTRIGAGRLSDQLGNRLRPLRWIGLASAAGLLATALLAQSRLSLVVTVIVVAGAVSMAWNGLADRGRRAGRRARAGAAIGFQRRPPRRDRRPRPRALRERR